MLHRIGDAGADIRARMSSYLTDRIRAHPNIEIHQGCTVRELTDSGLPGKMALASD